MKSFKAESVVDSMNSAEGLLSVNPNLITDYYIAKNMFNQLHKIDELRWGMLEKMLELSRDSVEVMITCIKSFGYVDCSSFRKRCIGKISNFTQESIELTNGWDKNLNPADYAAALIEKNKIRYEQIDLVNVLLITARIHNIAIEGPGGFYDNKNCMDEIANRMPEFSGAISIIEALHDSDWVDPRQWAFEMLVLVGNSAVDVCNSEDCLRAVFENTHSCKPVHSNAQEKLQKIPNPSDIEYF